jgi:hypothetical protein
MSKKGKCHAIMWLFHNLYLRLFWVVIHSKEKWQNTPMMTSKWDICGQYIKKGVNKDLSEAMVFELTMCK